MNIPCYLETSEEVNVSMNERFGFKLIEKAQLADGDVPLFAMIRKNAS